MFRKAIITEHEKCYLRNPRKDSLSRSRFSGGFSEHRRTLELGPSLADSKCRAQSCHNFCPVTSIVITSAAATAMVVMVIVRSILSMMPAPPSLRKTLSIMTGPAEFPRRARVDSSMASGMMIGRANGRDSSGRQGKDLTLNATATKGRK
jgi:hypothetical protein